MRIFLLITTILVLSISCTNTTTKKESATDSIKTNTVPSSNLSPAIMHEDGEEEQDTSKTDKSFDTNVISLGTGLVIANAPFDLFNDSLLKDKFETVNQFNGTSIKTHSRSKFYYPEYGIFHFVCIDSNDKAYKVLVNYSEFKFIPKHKQFFITWEDYIISSYGIRRSVDNGDNIAKLPLRTEASDKSGTIAIPAGQELFCPMEVKGDWVKVKYDCFYNEEDREHEGVPCHEYIEQCKNPVTGWLKWREGNKVLIDIFLMP